MTTVLVLAITMLWATVPAMATETSLRTCTLTRAYECTNDTGCKEWSMEEMALPRFVQIDTKEKFIKSLDRNMPRTATKVDAVYAEDPRKNPNAKRYDRLSYIEALNQRVGVMDSTAISLCMDNELPILVFDLWQPQSLERAVQGEPIGTIISGE